MKPNFKIKNIQFTGQTNFIYVNNSKKDNVIVNYSFPQRADSILQRINIIGVWKIKYNNQ